MKVMNVHERLLPAPPERVGALLDALAGPDDRLWPTAAWPASSWICTVSGPAGLPSQ